jgi:hypothetical protein
MDQVLNDPTKIEPIGLMDPGIGRPMDDLYVAAFNIGGDVFVCLRSVVEW